MEVWLSWHFEPPSVTAGCFCQSCPRGVPGLPCPSPVVSPIPYNCPLLQQYQHRVKSRCWPSTGKGQLGVGEDQDARPEPQLGSAPHPSLSASQPSGTSGGALWAALPREGPSLPSDRDLFHSSPLALTSDKPFGQ